MRGARIVGGRARGQRLTVPQDARVRPTTGRVREALFNVLGGRVAGARVLDLCAGTGALGLEALSRGAAEATFVEQGRACQQAIRRNLEATGFSGQGEVVGRSWSAALRELARAGERYDLILFDPPYAAGSAGAIVCALGRGELLAPGAVVVGEVRRGEPLPETEGRLHLAQRRGYGDTELALWLAAEKEAD